MRSATRIAARIFVTLMSAMLPGIAGAQLDIVT
jgi:hypothetical protein